MNMAGLLIHQTIPVAPTSTALAKTQVESKQEGSIFQQNLVTELSLTQDIITKHNETLENIEDQVVPIWNKLRTDIQASQHSIFLQESDLAQLDNEESIKQIKELFIRVESLLTTNLSDEDEMIKVSPEILDVLEKWLTQEKGYVDESILLNGPLVSSEDETQVLNLWRDLVNSFQVRNELGPNHYDLSNEKVTPQEIMEWLKASLISSYPIKKKENSEPLSLVEQDIIYINQNDLVQSSNIEFDDKYVEEVLANIDAMPADLLNELYHLLTGNTVSTDGMNESEKTKNLIALIRGLSNDQGMPLWEKLKTEIQAGENFIQEQLESYFMQSNFVPKTELTQLDHDAIVKQYKELFIQVEPLLTDLPREQEMIKISSRILEVLEKWVALEKKYDGEVVRLNLSQPSTESEKVLSLWKDLVSSFQKRNEMASSQYYQSSAKVTSKDISEWLKMNVNAQHSVENQIYTQQANVAQQPLSKVEQYVIYMNQNDAVTSTDKQLIDQFQQVMRTSRFLSLNNGMNQLSIALRPDNLGEMMVRFTEINGEMTLKIIVSSQATRQMLEANIHQLKNMFSPHQVIIEEREAIIENVQSQSDEQAFEEEKDHSNESSQEESRNLDEEFEMEFHEILMNEKV